MQLYRIHSAAYDALDTTGSALFAGRWHMRGARVVYTAEHISLAALEVLIHAGGTMPPKVLTTLTLPDRCTVETAPAFSVVAESQGFGDSWVIERRSVALRVASVAVNGLEANFVFNPAHPDFRSIRASKPVNFPFDIRLLAAR